ncbi:MAG: GNAT family N-acetyltransferase [Flavobacteriales bacterium]
MTDASYAFRLRPWLPTDANALAKCANNPKIAANLTNAFPHPYTLEHAESFIAMVMAHSTQRILCIEVNGQVAGSIGLHPQSDIMERNLELGYFLAEEFWGKGIATHAVKDMVKYGFDHFDVDRIYARPFGTNIASQRVLEKAGFKLEARFEQTIFKLGRFEDELYYAVRKTEL